MFEEADCETDFDRWIYVLKNVETLKRLPFKARKAVLRKLEKIVAVAREMKKAGVPAEQIARFTKLSAEEIKKL